MSFEDNFGGTPARQQKRAEEDLLDPVLEHTLANFRSSVLAWSEAAYSRPRTALAAAPQRQVWRLAAGWALGCVLMAGGVSGVFYEHHQRQELARIAAVREAEHQRQLAEQSARDEEELLAKVDSEVSREVPRAMEPLAQLMAEDESR
jgi:hypothetical protein